MGERNFAQMFLVTFNHERHCVVVLEQDINPSLVLVQPRTTRPCLTERLLLGHKESNQTSNQNKTFNHDGRHAHVR